MAVTKIRKISSWVLILCAVITLVILGLFFFGGDNEPYNGEMWYPIHTETLMYWMYALLVITAAATFIFAIWQFIDNLRQNPKGSIMGLIVIALFAGLLYITYAIGDGTLLPNLNEDLQQYNTSFWLKVTDMWLYSTYILVGLVVLAIIGGSVKKIFDK